ncbi:MAG TPA: hypothetical protein VFI42_01905 [Thermomicrobiaceae bacterium]|nr:hypothetical protein [Thermomicrobiaceae bacterium]
MRVVAALVLIVLAQLGLVAAAGAQGGAAGADGIVDVDPGPHARGEAKHPLLVRSYGRRSDGQPQVATAQPVAYAPDLIRA